MKRDMNRTVLLIGLVLGWTTCAFAQVDTGRDLSKYADDKFSEDDKYQVETPYQTVVVKQPKADVEMTVGDGQVTLVNKSGVISYMNILKAKDAAGNLVVPFTWSDNFFPILPGETKVVTFTAPTKEFHIELDN